MKTTNLIIRCMKGWSVLVLLKTQHTKGGNVKKILMAFVALAVLHMSGAYADGCRIVQNSGNTNWVNNPQDCTAYGNYEIIYDGYSQVAYYDCTACNNGKSPVQIELEAWTQLCGRTVFYGSCHECDYDWQCGADGWESINSFTEKYKHWYCGGNYCHWEYTDTRCNTGSGYMLVGDHCEKAPTCSSATYSCSGTNWSNGGGYDRQACASYSTRCFDISEGETVTTIQMFNCDSCKPGFTTVNKSFTYSDLPSCGPYPYNDCVCRKTGSDWIYDGGNHRYVKTIVDMSTCTETKMYECAEGYYGTNGNCTKCGVIEGVQSSSPRNSTSCNDCCIDVGELGSDASGSYKIATRCCGTC